MNSFKELPYVAQIAIVTLLVLVIAFASYMFGLQPMAKANEADALALKSKQAEIAQLTPYRAKLSDLNAQTENLKAQMEQQKKVVPEEKEVPNFITLVEKESVASGVNIRRYTPKDTSQKEYYVEVPFDVDIDGPYYSVLNFFDRVQNLERIVNVSHLTIGALKGGKSATKGSYKWAANETVSANCTLTTFYSVTKVGATPAPAPPPAKR